MSADADNRRLLVNGDYTTIICSSEDAMGTMVETIFRGSLLEAEFAYSNPESRGCYKARINSVDVTNESYEAGAIDRIPGYTHLVKVSFGSACRLDGRYLDECHMLLLRSMLFGIHDDLFNVLIRHRRLGTLRDFFEFFE